MSWWHTMLFKNHLRAHSWVRILRGGTCCQYGSEHCVLKLLCVQFSSSLHTVDMYTKKKIYGYRPLLWCITHLSPKKLTECFFFFFTNLNLAGGIWGLCRCNVFLSVVMKAIETLQYCSMMHLCTYWACFQYPSMCLQNHYVKVKWWCGKFHLPSLDCSVVEIVLQNVCSTAVNCVTLNYLDPREMCI